MAKSQLTSAQNTGSLTAGFTFYFKLGNAGMASTTTEANVDMPYRTAGTVSALGVQISSNDRATSTFRLRKNAANGNETISVTGSTTGYFTDLINTDSVTAGDKLNTQMVVGAGGSTFIVRATTAVYDASSGTMTRYSTTGFSDSTASSTEYRSLVGSEQTTVETGRGLLMKGTYTGRNLFATVTSNARTTATTLRTRVSAANGAMSVSVGSSATGEFEDTVNTDSLTSASLYNFASVTGTGTGSINFFLSVEVTNSSALSRPTVEIASEAFGVTVYTGRGGSTQGATTTETHWDTDGGFAATHSDAYCGVRSNSLNGGSTVNFRINGATGNLSVSIAATTTGTFEDLTGTDTVAATDNLAVQLATGGSSGSITVMNMSTTVDSGGPAGPAFRENVIIFS